MRISHNSLFDSFIQRIRRDFERLAGFQKQVSSGLKVEKPSDNPLSASKIAAFQANLFDVEQFQSSINESRTRLQKAEGLFADTRALLREAKEIALTGAHDPSNDSRKALANRVNDTTKDILQLANTKLQQQFLFSGSQTLTKPFTPDSESDPASFTYNGDFYTISSEVSFSRFLETSQTGLDAFGHFAHTIIAGRKVENPDAPLNVALGTSFSAAQTFTIRMGNAVTPRTISIDPRTQSLNDLVTTINAAANEAGVTAFLDPQHRLVFRSDVEGKEGKIELIDGAANGILTALQVANDSGRFLGVEKEPLNIFSSLTDLKLSLRDYVDSQELLVNLKNSSGTSLGLQVGDIIQLNFTVAGGTAQGPLNFAVTANSTLQDLADFIQAQLRTAGGASDRSETALVRIRQGALELINPNGVNQRNITAFTLRAFDSSLTVSRTDFNTVTAPLEVVPITKDEVRRSEIMTTSQPAAVINRRISEVESLISFVEKNQIVTAGKLKELELLDSRHLEFKNQTQELLSQERDIDISEAVIKLRQAEQVFQAALAAGARVLQPTLLDFLR